MPRHKKQRTVGELKASGYQPLTVREEMRRNLIKMIKRGRTAFPGIIGYDETVIPQIKNATISGQDIIFLGERGQAKSRLMRLMVNLLDDEVPIVKGCEINDQPLAPICKKCRDKLLKEGDATEIDWLPRYERYGEKLATPDIVVADLIGDIDPIKVAEGRYLSDELAIHYGLIPRSNRGIFCINELPDLSERLQVSLFNLMEEGDIQIRGYRVRLPLDILIVASANPEDYTSRGRIITPLKDRYGAQIRTHYPLSIEDEIAIIEQERRQFRGDDFDHYVSQYMKEIITEITQLARGSPEINQRSGVSVRISIANCETVLSNAIRRAISLNEKLAAPRMSDLPYIMASTRGKIELDSFEDMKEEKVVEQLIKKAVQNVFNRYYHAYDWEEMLSRFRQGFNFVVSDMMRARTYMRSVKAIPGMTEAIKVVADSERPEVIAAAVEFILEGLHLNKKLNKEKVQGKTVYRQ